MAVIVLEPPGRLNCVFEDPDGVLWIGTDNGLALFRSGRIQVPRSVSDALRDPVFGVDDRRLRDR